MKNIKEKYKKIKKIRGFTLIELLTVMALLGILLMIAVPSMEPARDVTGKNLANTTHKIFVNAIEYWSKDNSDSSQRPANFVAKNSQGHTVIDYISSSDVFNITNISKNLDGSINFSTPLEKGIREIRVTFQRGVLKTEYVKPDNSGVLNIVASSAVFGVFELNAAKDAVVNYSNWKSKNYILEADYLEIQS